MSILSIAENYQASSFGRPWSFVITTETHEIHLICKDYSDWRSVNKSTRVYGPEVTPEMERPPYVGRGKDKDVDKAWDAYNRAEVKLMKAEIEAAAKSVVGRSELAAVIGRFATGNSELTDVIAAMTQGLTFSRKAGCSCGCSAGFVSKMHVRFRNNAIDQISVVKK